jgi:hypothetical protein
VTVRRGQWEDKRWAMGGGGEYDQSILYACMKIEY